MLEIFVNIRIRIFITVFFILRNSTVFEKISNFQTFGYRNFVSSRYGSSNRARKNEWNQARLHEFAQKRVKVRSNGHVFMFEVVSECKRQKDYSSIWPNRAYSFLWRGYIKIAPSDASCWTRVSFSLAAIQFFPLFVKRC